MTQRRGETRHGNHNTCTIHYLPPSGLTVCVDVLISFWQTAAKITSTRLNANRETLKFVWTLKFVSILKFCVRKLAFSKHVLRTSGRRQNKNFANEGFVVVVFVVENAALILLSNEKIICCFCFRLFIVTKCPNKRDACLHHVAYRRSISPTGLGVLLKSYGTWRCFVYPILLLITHKTRFLNLISNQRNFFHFFFFLLIMNSHMRHSTYWTTNVFENYSSFEIDTAEILICASAFFLLTDWRLKL